MMRRITVFGLALALLTAGGAGAAPTSRACRCSPISRLPAPDFALPESGG